MNLVRLQRLTNDCARLNSCTFLDPDTWINDSFGTNNHSGSDNDIVCDPKPLCTFSMDQIFRVICCQDGDARGNDRSGTNLDGASIIKGTPFAHVDIVLNLQVIPVCTCEGRLDLDTKTNMSLTVVLGWEFVRSVLTWVNYFEQEVAHFLLGNAAVELTSSIVTFKGAFASLTFVYQGRIEVIVLAGPEHLGFLHVFLTRNLEIGPRWLVARRHSRMSWTC